MEEPPKIEQIISARGISLSDASAILTSYLSEIDQFHHRPDSAAHSQDEPAQSDDDGDKDLAAPRKSRQEREEAALIAQMDRLANAPSSSGTISDDAYERLRTIARSMRAEAEGRPWSASGAAAAISGSGPGAAAEGGEGEEREGGRNGEGSDFMAELEKGAEKLEEEEQERQQPQTPRSNTLSKRDKKKEKKEKKAKKAAKKAKKEAKRKAKEMQGGGDAEAGKRAKSG